MAATPFHLVIARVGEKLFDGEALSVTLPGTEGMFTVLAGHEPLVSALNAGEAEVRTPAGETRRFAVAAGGVAEISGNQATVLA